ncbi:DUF2691 family protein [Paenibacillus amylolyticus]|uniref:DUF2691 family protein n=1 Tax=Paenibacillus amylolyticus TaxID=1451 RepID=A0A5M9WZW2_PAEAM|nr:DUF2691 family protein [Paenibacillus amylolyticus]KAA8787049.1 DUF2691 family protein [Paenibacillus amylolyticus]
MKRGIQFTIPNAYGRFLGEILKSIKIADYDWFVGGEESYLVVENSLGGSLFPDRVMGMAGEELQKMIDDNKYYLIFANLKAYPRGTAIIDIETYEDYAESECQLVLLVIDSSYVAVYIKDTEIREEMFEHIKRLGYEALDYITDDNEVRTKLSVW